MPFMYDGKNVDIVDDYTYLGVVFNRNGSFKKAISKQIAQAKKAIYAILQKARVLKLPIDIVCQLYEACVIPVLLYGSEIWGYECLKLSFVNKSNEESDLSYKWLKKVKGIFDNTGFSN